MAAVKRQAAHMAQQRAAIAQAQAAQAQAHAQGHTQPTVNGINGQADQSRPTPDGNIDAGSTQPVTHPPAGDSVPHPPQPSPSIAINGTPTPDGRLSVSAEIRGTNSASPGFNVRSPFDHIEEVGQILKTAFPLLIMSLETIVDQVMQRFKATPEEEIYRLVCMLLQDAVQVRHILSYWLTTYIRIAAICQPSDESRR